MNPGKARIKKTLIIQHRQERYFSAMQALIDGKGTRAHVSYRWNKLQEALGKKR